MFDYKLLQVSQKYSRVLLYIKGSTALMKQDEDSRLVSSVEVYGSIPI